MDELSLAHCKYECKYHIVFAPKFRRQIIYGKIKREVGKILRKLCEYKGIEILEAEACPDHIHMLGSVPPKYSVAQVRILRRHSRAQPEENSGVYTKAITRRYGIRAIKYERVYRPV